MSHQVTVDFEGLSTQIQIQCETAAHSLCKIDKTLVNVRKNANRIQTQKLKEYEEYLLNSKDTIQKQIDLFTAKLEEYKALKIQRIDSDVRYANGAQNVSMVNKWNELNTTLKTEGQNLARLVADLTGAKLAVIDQLVNEGLLEEITNASQELQNQINGVRTFDQSLLGQINAIDDVSLRELAYQQMVKGNADFNSIMSNAQQEYDKILGRSSFVEDIKEEMKASGVSQEEIREITSKSITAQTVNEMAANANTAIADEKIRKETLKVIIKSIKDRGFVVDTKKNLKIDRQRNVVKLVAVKPDGKTAEFEISLNGKFMYRFEGYEGQACNKDINPFIEDLKNVYDINILHEEVQWSNPDKIQTQKYQYMNTNKGKN